MSENTSNGTWPDELVESVKASILASFHAPDDLHPSWWINTDEKRRAWRAVTNRFMYLVPKGLVTPDEVADGCGLWEFDPGMFGPYRWQHGITLVKRATVNKTPDPLPFQVTRALAYRVSNYERKVA